MEWYLDSCCIQKQERGKNARNQNERLLTGGVLTSMSLKFSSPARTSPFFRLQVVHFRDDSRTSLKSFANWYLVLFCRFLLTSFFMCSHRNRINSFGQYWREWHLHLWENDWNTWRVEIFCVHRPKSLTAASSQGYKILKEWIQRLCGIVVDCMFVATNHSTNDRRIQTLRLDTNLLVLTRDLFVHWGTERADLH